ncbi:MAG: 50S ribosomal protein L20 [Clostridiales bacterium]|jgi:large subunit ribosomal protein L20|nr:50S ribosomal protein L20 [Clostridiales bacterium]MDR2713072.1 50S ribosomal protein L20 [Clostridiales bacterium]
MTRVKKGMTKHRRHKKILKLAKGYRASNSKLFRVANEQVLHSMAYAFAHRRKKKGDFRKLWITRINAAARMNNISYSRMMNGLHKAGVVVNRKMLAELAVNDAAAFSQFAELAKANL